MIITIYNLFLQLCNSSKITACSLLNKVYFLSRTPFSPDNLFKIVEYALDLTKVIIFHGYNEDAQALSAKLKFETDFATSKLLYLRIQRTYQIFTSLFSIQSFYHSPIYKLLIRKYITISLSITIYLLNYIIKNVSYNINIK